MLVPTAGVGMLAAVAIPAFLDYRSRGRATEADLVLDRLSKNLEVLHVTNAAFPAGDTGRVPAQAACSVPGRKHPGGTDAFEQNPIFRELELVIDDDFRCQYQYVGTATEYTATAYCDLDCDMNEVKVIARGTIDAGGTPTVTFSREGTD